MDHKKSITVSGMPIGWFVGVLAITLAAMYLEVLPDKMMGGFTIALILGVGLNWLGDQVPVLKDYGLGTILAVLLPAVLLYLGILPESAGAISKNFFSGYDYTSFLVPSLLVGSILAMDRKVLINAGARFIIPMASTIVLATFLSGLVGLAMGYGMLETMLYIAGPILGSGVSASAVPLSEVYASYSGQAADYFLTTLTSSVMIANILTILSASILSAIGSKNHDFIIKGFAGTGGNDLLRSKGSIKITEEQKKELVSDPDSTTFTSLRVGFMLTCGFYAFGQIGAHFVPFLNAYVWMIVPAILFKVLNLCPECICSPSGAWTKFMSKVLTPAALAAISLGVLNLKQIVGLLQNPTYVILCVLCVLITLIVSGVLSYLFGFYFMEGSIMAGLGLADMGGTGDVAVLAAAKRMELLPFLTICSRIGGSINMVWLTFLAARFL